MDAVGIEPTTFHMLHLEMRSELIELEPIFTLVCVYNLQSYP
jgi:hypothetical protein